MVIGIANSRKDQATMLQMVAPADQRNRAPNHHARAFQQVLHEVFGVPFALFDTATGEKVAGAGSVPDYEAGCDLDPESVIALADGGQVVVEPCEGNAFRIAVLLHAGSTPVLVGVGVVPALAGTGSTRAVEQTRLQAWARDFSERLRLRDQLAVRARNEEDLRHQLTSAWKVTLTLGECMQRLRFNRHEVRDRQRILQAALELLNARALLWAPMQSGHPPLIAGDAPLLAEQIRSLAADLDRAAGAQGPEPYLCNDPSTTSWGPCYPRIHSLLAFKVTGQASSVWLIAVNKYGKVSSRTPEGETPLAPFRNSDAALLCPFVNMLDMHARAAGKFDELRSLLVGLARSLTAAIDAKDAYTAGHSERVARLATEIGRELRLPEEQLSDTYLAGLLHDVGKIGIRESVLCKPGQLSPDEFEHMKQHVTIGYHILHDLHLIRHLLPGVLHHHERFDGRGYPDRLTGQQIPFLARLLAVADGFDAMNSNRPYRPALTHSRVFAELKRGAGTQWDPDIVAAALNCQNRLVQISERGLGESLRQAIDAALRTGESSLLGHLRASSPLPGR
jgi:HD-GYP domain-containing protein (c-di-GMP phosphodiesterase class II)